MWNDASCSIGKNMHANCVSYERMYSTGSGTYANVSTEVAFPEIISVKLAGSVRHPIYRVFV
jgi:hypothetical protein